MKREITLNELNDPETLVKIWKECMKEVYGENQSKFERRFSSVKMVCETNGIRYFERLCYQEKCIAGVLKDYDFDANDKVWFEK